MTEPIKFERNFTTKDLEEMRNKIAGLKDMHWDFDTSNMRIVEDDAPKSIFGVNYEGDMTEFLSLPKLRIPEMAAEFVSWIEIAETDKWCKCEWAIHPDDEAIEEGKCRKCTESKEHDNHVWENIPDITYQHNFIGRRKRLVDQNEQCPIHTKVGLILGFFEWLFTPEMHENKDND